MGVSGKTAEEREQSKTQLRTKLQSNSMEFNMEVSDLGRSYTTHGGPPPYTLRGQGQDDRLCLEQCQGYGKHSRDINLFI